MRMIPPLIMQFRMIGTEYCVLVALPVFASFNVMVLVESNRLNLLRFWLRVEVCVLRFDLLHLLWFGLFRLYSRISLGVLLARCRRWLHFICLSSRRISRCFRCCGGFVHTFSLLLSLLCPLLLSLLFPFLLSLLLRIGCRSVCRFPVRATLFVLSDAALIGRSASRLT